LKYNIHDSLPVAAQTQAQNASSSTYFWGVTEGPGCSQCTQAHQGDEIRRLVGGAFFPLLLAVFLLRSGLIAYSPHYRSPQEIVKQGVIEVSTRELFDLEGGGRKAKKNGALDGRMVGPPLVTVEQTAWN